MRILSENHKINEPFHFCTGNKCKPENKTSGTLCRGEIISPLFLISSIIKDSESFPDMIPVLLNAMAEQMGVVRGMINLFDRKTGKIFIHDSIGLTEEEENRGIYSLGEGITGKVVEKRESIIVPKISNEPNFLNRTRSHIPPDDNNTSFICVPIVRGKKVLGTISVERVCDNPAFLNYDAELLGIIATMIAQAVELYIIEHEEKLFWRKENERLTDALKEKFRPSNIIGNSKPMLEVYSLISKISRTKSTVLLLGESGVGKELVANAIHYNSSESNLPFIKFNCAALPETLIESELFGHEKGAFTSADFFRKGRFEEADGGTIFLDEVGELSLSIQAKLLRVIQERSFERVGGNKSIKVNIRIITATNKDLIKLVSEGKFREDLFYRLSVFPILIPPLREREGDIITLTDHFIAKFAKFFSRDVKRISIPAQDMLISYTWPGNVRELENVIERAVILCEDNTIHCHNLPISMQSLSIPSDEFEKSLSLRLNSVEYEMIIEALNLHKGNISAAAMALGLTRRKLGLRMDKFKIKHSQFK